MRIVWKDSNPLEYKDVKYRNHIVSGTPKGWITNAPGDGNIYSSHYCALNAIDEMLGIEGRRVRGKGNLKRQAYGIEIIGKKEGESA